ncbi:peptidyl-tRNA hydrolase [Nocardia sp. BMG51109]|uniref:peptidyl-tRNA hydrolase n=1 Tax=Nocardia sp. BMG51109 TaxID=1056816 RepID=UPI0004647917|nr:peptidyl-tRNA hydrolase [Nocardia sp. BMG51109]
MTDSIGAATCGPDEQFVACHAELAGGYGGGGDPADPALVQAMQVVLHLPKVDPPPRSALLEAAATAAVALCLDPRVGPGGEWEQRYLAWKRSRIRKVARRARGAQWLAAGEVEGVTVDVGAAQARALVPGPVGDVDPRIRKLQIRMPPASGPAAERNHAGPASGSIGHGTDLEADEPGPTDPELPVLWVNSELGMTVGKAAAQVGHASMLLAGALSVQRAYAWSRRGLRCSVREAGPRQWPALCERVRQGSATAVRDAGFTEVAPGSITVIAVPPVPAAVPADGPPSAR